jgi:ribosomal protein S27E
VWGHPLWCLRCTERFTGCLNDFPRVAVEILKHALFGTATRDGVSIHHRPAVYAWPGQQCRLLTEEIRDALTALEDDVRQLRCLPERKIGMREGVAITTAADFLAGHVEWIVEHHPIADDPEDAPPAYLMRLHARAIRFVGDGQPHTVWKPTPCGGCGGFTLFQQDGGEYIECSNCGRLLTDSEYRRRTHEEVKEQERLLASGDTSSIVA